VKLQRLTLRVLPMELQVGDAFTDEAGEWEVIGRPVSVRAGKVVRARVRRRDDAAVTRDATWPAYEKLTIQRLVPAETPPPARAARRGRGRA
jgi:hypothetical protein